MCRSLVKHEVAGLPVPKYLADFMILIATLMPPKHSLKGIIDKDYPIPTCFIFDPEDHFDPTFENKTESNGEHTIINHKGGHTVPKFVNKEMETFAKFINEQYAKKFGSDMELSHKIDEQFRKEFKKQLSTKPVLSKM
mmetsp:Transcript_5622/g.4833  ORF Transcript_5622/g.4833 Transcript_5622/m.4833 type:complete len:138 (+) Transcript_5622:369-782(+)